VLYRKSVQYEEAIAKIEQVGRERAALEAFYADLMSEMKQEADARRKQGEDGPSLPADVVALIAKLTNALETERQHVAMLWELLVDAHRRLAESYDVPLPPEFPTA